MTDELSDVKEPMERDYLALGFPAETWVERTENFAGQVVVHHYHSIATNFSGPRRLAALWFFDVFDESCSVQVRAGNQLNFSAGDCLLPVSLFKSPLHLTRIEKMLDRKPPYDAIDIFGHKAVWQCNVKTSESGKITRYLLGLRSETIDTGCQVQLTLHSRNKKAPPFPARGAIAILEPAP